jgi:hypothetical protein
MNIDDKTREVFSWPQHKFLVFIQTLDTLEELQALYDLAQKMMDDGSMPERSVTKITRLRTRLRKYQRDNISRQSAIDILASVT